MQSVLILAGVMFVIGAALSAGAVNLSMVVLGRLVLGLGVGGGTTVRSHGRLFLVCLVCLTNYTLSSAGLCLSAHGSRPCEGVGAALPPRSLVAHAACRVAAGPRDWLPC